MQKFGTKASGSSKGTEFVLPEGVAVTQGGMIWVTDYSGNRIAEFRETVSSESERFVRNATGATIELPRGIAVDGSGDVWATNVGSNQLLEFSSEGGFIRSVGSSGSGNGQLSNPGGVAIDPSGRIYVVDQNNSRVQVFGPNGEFILKFGTAGSGNGNFTEPKAIAFGAGGAMFISDKGNNRVHKWLQVPPPDQVTSIEVKVDGKAVSTTPLGCLSPSCTLAKEWVLKSAEYLGSHSVVVKATTAAGWSTTKTLTVEAHHDETAPSIEAGGALMKAPEGWVEQEGYGFTASATDGGYGVTSLAFKIDGKSVVSITNTCPDGGCKAAIAKSVDMAAYSGGAHQAELVATDGTGNTASKHWTINVDPEGHITAGEVESTLEAVDNTSESALVASSEEALSPQELTDGDAPILKEGAYGLETTWDLDQSIVATNPESGFTVETPEGTLSGAPLGVDVGATPVVDANEAAAVSGNIGHEVDTVIRPIYDGILDFGAIRGSSAPETLSWEVHLGEGQFLKLINSQQAEIDYENGAEAGLISTEPAHDAVGTGVPTHISINEGNIVTLTIEHKEGNFVYPVLAGTGWEGGFRTEVVQGPEDEQEEREHREEREREEQEQKEREGAEGEGEPEVSGHNIAEVLVSVPEPATPAEAEVSAAELDSYERTHVEHRRFRYIGCHVIDEVFDPTNPLYGEMLSRSRDRCGNPFTRDEGPKWTAYNYGIRGSFFRVLGRWAKHVGSPTEHIECAKMYDRDHIDGQGWVKYHYFIDPAQKCLWWGKTKYSEETIARYGKHLTPYGEWNTGIALGEGWGILQAGLGLYIWGGSPDGYIGHHPTTCIDC